LEEWQRKTKRVGNLAEFFAESPLRESGLKIRRRKTVSRSQAAGRPIGATDASLAATAETHQLTLVTRSVADFPLLKAVLDPWT
jgi:predicted nucleic acid-binding protein